MRRSEKALAEKMPIDGKRHQHALLTDHGVGVACYRSRRIREVFYFWLGIGTPQGSLQIYISMDCWF